MKNIQSEFIDGNLLERLEQGLKLARICYLNESLAANFQDLEVGEVV